MFLVNEGGRSATLFWKLFEKSPNRFPSPRMICTFVTLFKKQ